MKSTRPPAKKAAGKRSPSGTAHRFESAKLDALFTVLDAVAWLELPTNGEVAQFAGLDPRTAGKHLKNACQIGLVDLIGSGYALILPYPYRKTGVRFDFLMGVELSAKTGVRVHFLEASSAEHRL